MYWIQLVHNREQWQKPANIVTFFQKAQLAIMKFSRKILHKRILACMLTKRAHVCVISQKTVILILTDISGMEGFNTCKGRTSFLPPCPSQGHSPSNLLLKALALKKQLEHERLYRTKIKNM
jgi:hypothetical protein